MARGHEYATLLTLKLRCSCDSRLIESNHQLCFAINLACLQLVCDNFISITLPTFWNYLNGQFMCDMFDCGFGIVFEFAYIVYVCRYEDESARVPFNLQTVRIRDA